MKKIIFVLFLLILPSVLAGTVELALLDGDVPITDAIAYLSIADVSIVDYVPASGILEIELERGEHHLELIVDSPDTKGNDYATSFTVIQKDTVSSDVVMTRVGSIRGFAIDELDNALPDANLSLSCTSPFVIDAPTRTDAFGAFFIKASPIGPCRLHASLDDMSGYLDLDISHGDLQDVTIVLSEPTTKINKSLLLIVLLSVLLLFLIGIRLINWMLSKDEKKLWRKSSKVKKEDAQNRAMAAMKKKNRAADIIETLPADEKRIVKHLMSHRNTAVQAIMRHDLDIARTTMSRLISRIEGKGIIMTTKHGKSVRIRLTPWFLEKE